MYGMTEVGVIATDLFGEHRPAVLPAPGLTVREEGGELHVSLPASPYLGDQDRSRWSDGWLHTRDAGSVDSARPGSCGSSAAGTPRSPSAVSRWT